MSSAGGPSNSTRTIVLYMYNQMFNYNERISGIGYAATIAWMLAILTFAITAIQFFLGRRFVYYEALVAPTRRERRLMRKKMEALQ